MAGIETNPGPTVADMARWLDELFSELREIRTDRRTKTADSTIDLTPKMQAFEQQVALFTVCLDALERAQLAMHPDIDSLMIYYGNWTLFRLSSSDYNYHYFCYSD